MEIKVRLKWSFFFLRLSAFWKGIEIDKLKLSKLEAILVFVLRGRNNLLVFNSRFRLSNFWRTVFLKVCSFLERRRTDFIFVKSTNKISRSEKVSVCWLVCKIEALSYTKLRVTNDESSMFWRCALWAMSEIPQNLQYQIPHYSPHWQVAGGNNL